MNAQLETILLLNLTALACVVPGVFLVLRRLALLGDAIGHVLVLGIVLSYFVTRDLKSPWLIVGASLSALAMVALVELVKRIRTIREDSAIGLVFPAFFALGVLLITLKTRNIHLDVDQVLLGQPEMALLPHLFLGGFDWGPKAPFVMGLVLFLNLALLSLFFKEWKLSAFDAGLAAALGFLPTLMHYLLMAITSWTAVAAFDTAGAILMLAFLVLPAMTAQLFVERLPAMFLWSAVFACVGATLGTIAALRFDLTIAGTVAVAYGVQFGAVFGWVQLKPTQAIS